MIPPIPVQSLSRLYPSNPYPANTCPIPYPAYTRPIPYPAYTRPIPYPAFQMEHIPVPPLYFHPASRL